MKGKRGRGTAHDDKVPVLGMVQRGGCVIIRALENVQRKTIEPIIRQKVKQGAKVFTDEYNIYNWLSDAYEHKTVNHSQGEYARDEDGDGKCEVHVNTMEGFGPCSGRGSGHTGAFCRNAFPFAWDSLNFCIISDKEALTLCPVC